MAVLHLVITPFISPNTWLVSTVSCYSTLSPNSSQKIELLGTMGRQQSSNNRTRSEARSKGDDDDSSVTPVIPRRYPRVGSTFQTKVPTSVEGPYQPSRQPAVLLSKDFPDVPQGDVIDDIISYIGESSVLCYSVLSRKGAIRDHGFDRLQQRLLWVGKATWKAK